jgi:hypothetical protein
MGLERGCVDCGRQKEDNHCYTCEPCVVKRIESLRATLSEMAESVENCLTVCGWDGSLESLNAVGQHPSEFVSDCIESLRAENERLGTALDSAGQYVGQLEKAEARAGAAERALVAGRVEAGRMWDLLECLDDQCAEGGAGAVQAIHVELHAVLAFRDAARAAGEGE